MLSSAAHIKRCLAYTRLRVLKKRTGCFQARSTSLPVLSVVASVSSRCGMAIWPHCPTTVASYYSLCQCRGFGRQPLEQDVGEVTQQTLNATSFFLASPDGWTRNIFILSFHTPREALRRLHLTLPVFSTDVQLSVLEICFRCTFQIPKVEKRGPMTWFLPLCSRIAHLFRREQQKVYTRLSNVADSTFGAGSALR